MTRRILMTAVCLTALFTAQPAAQILTAPDVALQVDVADLGDGQCMLSIVTEGPIGEATLLSFAFYAGDLTDGPGPIQLMLPATENGQQRFQVAVAAEHLPDPAVAGFRLPGPYVRNFFKRDGVVFGSPTVEIAQAAGGPTTTIDFDDKTPGELDPSFAPALIAITCDNYAVNGPDQCVVFDSGNPTGGDDDLATPGPHPSNDTPRGNILVIAEDVEDSAPADGLVDDPDDAQWGGNFVFSFDEPVMGPDASVLDVDPDETLVARLFLGDVLVFESPFPDFLKGDNAFTLFNSGTFTFDRMEFDFSGSGAIVDIREVPTVGQQQ